MVTWWVTEAIPIPATALLPILLFPLLGVTDIGGATRPYANPLIYLFMGGFVIALAMERSGLHRRIALNIIGAVGTRPTSLVLGFMLAAAVLSMWVSNTATAMMMLPIALSLLSLSGESERPANLAPALLLGLAYACNIGGIGTLIGTPPNALLAGYMLDSHGIGIGFVQWMLLGVPLVMVSIPLVYLVLTGFVYPLRGASMTGAETLLRDARAERRVALVFAMTALLWVCRPLLEPWLPGLSDTGIAILGALLILAVPLDWKRMGFVLEWEDTRRLPWGVLVLFGGGLSLASGIADSGLAEWMGRGFVTLDGAPLLLVTGLVVLAIVFLTEVTSNTATTAAFLPILGAAAVGLGFAPVALAAPAAIAASCAFMLPVATPPNAIVYGSGRVSVPQMAKAGLVLNLAMVIVVTVGVYAVMGWVFANA